MRKAKENRNCPYCLSPIGRGQERVRCPQCGVVHHAECWKANESCSVYGCDGWDMWKTEIAERGAPQADEAVEVSRSAAENEAKQPETLCIRCGKPVGSRRLVCFSCRRRETNHWFDNCSGPALLMLGGIVTMVTVVVRALT